MLLGWVTKCVCLPHCSLLSGTGLCNPSNREGKQVALVTSLIILALRPPTCGPLQSATWAGYNLALCLE